MKLLLKILVLIITIFQTNICEAKVILFADIISEPTFSNIFNSEENSAELKGIFSESGIANTCKSENDLVDYRNRGIRVEANAAKGERH